MKRGLLLLLLAAAVVLAGCTGPCPADPGRARDAVQGPLPDPAQVSGASHWSEHAFGRAVDLNPLRNPGYWSGSRDYQHFSSTGR